MEQYIPKSALVAAIKKIYNEDYKFLPSDSVESVQDFKDDLLITLNTLEVKELVPIAYVVTRCEEHSDYVEEVFVDKDKAQEYCDQFNGNENEYARHITKVKVTL